MKKIFSLFSLSGYAAFFDAGANIPAKSESAPVQSQRAPVVGGPMSCGTRPDWQNFSQKYLG